MSLENKMEGVVRWFSAQKGFGFIGVDGREDVFVHHSKIVTDGYRSLNEGDRVEFHLEHDPVKKRDQAVDVMKMQGA